LSIDLQIGIRGATLKALEEKMIIDVARVNKDRRRDGDRESKEHKQEQNSYVIMKELKPIGTSVIDRHMVHNFVCDVKKALVFLLPQILVSVI
jgi:hypothetical protein